MKPCLPQFSHIKRYDDPVNEIVSAKLLPGQYYVTTQNEMITTLLGSCISVCIYDEKTGHGGMNHFMLPGEAGDRKSGWSELDEESTRYGLYAMEGLINDVLKCGSRRENLRAKAFGGGKIIENMTDVGRRNISFVRQYLQVEGLTLVGSDLGLIYPRKVNFFPQTGKVMVKRLHALRNDTIQRREKDYIAGLKKIEISGPVELF